MKKQCGRQKKDNLRTNDKTMGEYDARISDRCGVGKSYCALRILEARRIFRKKSLLEHIIVRIQEARLRLAWPLVWHTSTESHKDEELCIYATLLSTARSSLRYFAASQNSSFKIITAAGHEVILPQIPSRTQLYWVLLSRTEEIHTWELRIFVSRTWKDYFIGYGFSATEDNSAICISKQTVDNDICRWLDGRTMCKCRKAV